MITAPTHPATELARLTRSTASPRAARILLGLLVLSLAASSLLQRYLGHPLAGGNVDFNDYFVAGQLVRAQHHADLYEGAALDLPIPRTPPAGSALLTRARADGLDDIELYLYPPLLADLLAPLAPLTPQQAAALWRLVNLAALLGLIAVIARWLGLRLLSPATGLLALALLSAWPANESILLGQISIVITLLWAAGILAFAEGYIVLSAAAFALATGLKVTPLLIVPLFLFWKQLRWAAWYAAFLAVIGAAMLAINGPANLLAFLHVMNAMNRGTPVSAGKSIQTLLAWLYYRRTFDIGMGQSLAARLPAAFQLASKLAALAFYAACLVPAWRNRATSSRRTRLLTLALFGIVVCLIAPISWRHGYVLAFAPLAALWLQSLTQPVPRLRLALLALASFTIGTLFFDLATRAHLPALFKVACAAVWTISCLVLCLEVLYAGEDPTVSPHLSTPAPLLR